MVSYGTPSASIVLNGRPVPEASPTKLWRKQNNAAILDFVIPRRTYLSLKDIEKEFRQGMRVELWLGDGAASQRVFYGYLPSVALSKSIDPEQSEIRLSAYDFVGQLQDTLIGLDASELGLSGVAVLGSGTGAPGSGGGSSLGGAGGRHI